MKHTYKPQQETTGLHAVNILGINVTIDSKKTILEYLKKYLQHAGQKEKINEKNTGYVVQKGINPLIIVTPNPEQIVYAGDQPEFRIILNQADVAIPDGTGVVWAMNVKNVRLPHTGNQMKIERIPGVELMENLVSIGAKQGVTIGLIGGKDGVALKAFECLREKYLTLTGWAEEPAVTIKSQKPYFTENKHTGDPKTHKNSSEMQLQIIGWIGREDEYFKKLAERIIKTNTNMIFVALGAPKQEYFMDALRYELSDFVQKRGIPVDKSTVHIPVLPKIDGKNMLTSQKNQNHSDTTHQFASPAVRETVPGIPEGLHFPVILMAVGGSFDIITGHVQRAPLVMRSIGFEWLWRLLIEPWRWRRQLALLKFIFLILRSGKKNT